MKAWLQRLKCKAGHHDWLYLWDPAGRDLARWCYHCPAVEWYDQDQDRDAWQREGW